MGGDGASGAAQEVRCVGQGVTEAVNEPDTDPLLFGQGGEELEQAWLKLRGLPNGRTNGEMGGLSVTASLLS